MRGRVPPAPPSRAAVAVWTGSEYSWTVPTVDGLVLTAHEDPDGRIWVRWEASGVGGGGGAPTTAQYVTLATDGTLTQERVLTGTAGQLTITDGGANGPVTLASSTSTSAASGRSAQRWRRTERRRVRVRQGDWRRRQCRTPRVHVDGTWWPEEAPCSHAWRSSLR